MAKVQASRPRRVILRRPWMWLRARWGPRHWRPEDARARQHLQPDFITQLSLCVMIYGVFLARLVWASGTAGDAAKPPETPSHDRALHIVESAGAAPAGGAALRCLARADAAFFVVDCGGVGYERWLFGAPNDLRVAAGAPPCWWHASWQDLQRVRGITESNAMLAVKLRERATRLARPEELATAMGAHRARLLTMHTSLRCAMESREAGQERSAHRDME